MKVKKVILPLLVSLYFCTTIFSQEYKTETLSVSDAFIIPQSSTIRINPNSDDYRINQVVIQEVYFSRYVSPKNGLDFNKVSYTITPKNTNIAVFYGEYDAMTENKYELFITEENVYKIKIPKFSWSGESLPKDSDEARAYIKKDGKVIDGEYILKIDLLRYADTTDKTKTPEAVCETQAYRIEIDTTPPIIDCKTLLVCDNFEENKFSCYIVPEYHGSEEYKYLANEWQIIGEKKQSKKFSSDLPFALPAFSLAEFADGEKIRIIAKDELGNTSVQKEIIVEPRMFEIFTPQPEVEKLPEPQIPQERTNQFDYFKAVQEILSSFCNNQKFDFAKPFCNEFYIPQDKQELINLNFEKYPTYIVFSANDKSEIKIPIEYVGEKLMFNMEKNDFEKDSYHIFVSDCESATFMLGQKYIYDSSARQKIVTLVGFDQKSHLDEPDIIFPASCPSFLEDENLAKENLQVIKTAVEIIKDNIEDIERVEILGYANPETAKRGEKALINENENSLLPLSQKRAEYVKQIMELMGLPEDLFVIIPCGGKVYEFNPNDKEVSYKNRRVRINVVRNEK